jgi:hypothetical protein
MGAEARPARPKLESLMNDENEYVRRASRRALAADGAVGSVVSVPSRARCRKRAQVALRENVLEKGLTQELGPNVLMGPFSPFSRTGLLGFRHPCEWRRNCSAGKEFRRRNRINDYKRGARRVAPTAPSCRGARIAELGSGIAVRTTSFRRPVVVNAESTPTAENSESSASDEMCRQRVRHRH